MDNRVRRITYGGLMTSLVFVATAIIPHIPIPFTEGYIHAGDSMIFVAAIILGWRYGAIAGGLGSAMADLFLGYSHWALPTLIIKGIMGAIVGFMACEYKKKNINIFRRIISIIIGGGWILIGVSLKKILGTKLNANNANLINDLINEFELSNIDQLIDLVEYVQISLSIAIISVPLVVLILYLIFNKKDNKLFNFSSLSGMTLAGVWMVVGYYIAGGILQGNMLSPIFSIPSNFIQFVGGAVIAFPIIIGLRKTKYFGYNNKDL